MTSIFLIRQKAHSSLITCVKWTNEKATKFNNRDWKFNDKIVRYEPSDRLSAKLHFGCFAGVQPCSQDFFKSPGNEVGWSTITGYDSGIYSMGEYHGCIGHITHVLRVRCSWLIFVGLRVTDLKDCKNWMFILILINTTRDDWMPPLPSFPDHNSQQSKRNSWWWGPIWRSESVFLQTAWHSGTTSYRFCAMQKSQSRGTRAPRERTNSRIWKFSVFETSQEAQVHNEFVHTLVFSTLSHQLSHFVKYNLRSPFLIISSLYGNVTNTL